MQAEVNRERAQARKRLLPAKHKIQQLLVLVGLPKNRIYVLNGQGRNGSPFWALHPHQLLDILHDAHNSFRRRMKEVHPDRNGDHNKTAELTLAWRTIKRRFAAKGVTLC